MSAPSSTAPNAHEVNGLVAADIQTSLELSELLAKESDALKSRDQNQLNDLLVRKQELMQILDQNAKIRDVWLNLELSQSPQNSEQNKKSIWSDLLMRMGGPKLIDSWQQLEKNISECKKRNEVNGIMIARGRQTMKQLLNIIRGHSLEAPKLYTASGGTKLQEYSQPLVKA
jgi:flagellar biosynthesis/type III secretory pathway chaperone